MKFNRFSKKHKDFTARNFIEKKSIKSSAMYISLIRHCWKFLIYKKKSNNFYFIEKFVNLLMIDGKKSKAFKLLNNVGLLTRIKLLQNFNKSEHSNVVDNYLNQSKIAIENRQETLYKVKRLFAKTKNQKTYSLQRELQSVEHSNQTSLVKSKPSKNRRSLVSRALSTKEVRVGLHQSYNRPCSSESPLNKKSNKVYAKNLDKNNSLQRPDSIQNLKSIYRASSTIYDVLGSKQTGPTNRLQSLDGDSPFDKSLLRLFGDGLKASPYRLLFKKSPKVLKTPNLSGCRAQFKLRNPIGKELPSAMIAQQVTKRNKARAANKVGKPNNSLHIRKAIIELPKRLPTKHGRPSSMVTDRLGNRLLGNQSPQLLRTSFSPALVLFSFNQILHQAIENVKPSVEVRKVRVAGTTYFVPAIISKKRQQTLAIKWIIDSARNKKRNSNTSFAHGLADELVDAILKQGQARQKRDDLHKLTQLNRAYTRYRWW